MKKAFTLLELVFVIIVVGILAAVIIPKTKTNPLQEAAVQLLSDIRYTQHLALVDDMFNANDENWYKQRWQMKFSKVSGSDNQWAYAIFSDANADGNPNVVETAVNPLNSAKRLTGGYSGTIEYSDKKATRALNLGHKYSVSRIYMTEGCSIADDGRKRIAFDYLGRPIAGALHTTSVTGPYKGITLIKSTCKIILNSGDENITVAIEPETGYAHIL